MGVSTDGIIVFGIPLEEGVEFPDIEGFEEDFAEYVYQKHEEDKEFPELVIHCSYDYALYILAVPHTKVTAHWGYTQKIDILPTITEEQIKVLYNFLDTYGLRDAVEGDPGWYLCSLWG